MSRLKIEAPPRMPDAANGDNHRCAAHGCPLRATIFPTVIGTPIHGVCRYHDRTPPSEWPSLTAKIIAGPFTREYFESVALPWLEPQARPRVHAYHSKITGITVTGPESFRRWFAAFHGLAPEVHKPAIGTLVHAGAIARPPIDPELAAERAAMRSQDDPL